MVNLSQFRMAFCLEAPVCGLTDRAAGLLWEKMIQSLFVHLSGGTSSLLAMRVRLSKLPKDLTLTVAMAFASEHLGLTLTKQEFGGLVTSLTADMQSKQRPFPECAKKMFKSLSGMLEEIQWYGLFQQVLYLVSRCLNTDPHQRPSLSELRRLAIFGLSEDDTTLAKAGREAKMLMAPYIDTKAFFSAAILVPFTCDLTTLIAQTTIRGIESSDSSPDESLIASMHCNLEKVSAYMGCIEELVSLAVKKGTNKCRPSGDEEDSLGFFLSGLGVEASWLHERSVEVLLLAVDSNMLSAIALYVLRFLSTEASQRSSDVRLLGGISRRNETEKDTKGLSIGSRLIMRMAKFMQHMSLCLCSLSRDLLLPVMLKEQLARD